LISTLRFELTAEDAARVADLPYLAKRTTGEPTVREQAAVWFDTPGLDLRDHGVVLRIDREGERRIQSVSSREDSGAASEWRTELVGEGPEPQVLPEGPPRRLLVDPGVGDRLQPVFSATLSRAERRLKLARGGEARLVVETGELRAGESAVPLRLGTLELLAGSPALLYQLALTLHRECPFRITPADAAALGYARIAPEKPAPRKAPAIDLDGALTAGEAFRRIAASCLTHMDANTACACAGDDPEGVHQVRVAARRLRSAISIFRDALPRPWTDRLARGVRWLSREMGEAREWDVFLAETLAPLRATMPEEPGLALIAERGSAARAQAYERVRAALADPKSTRLLLDLARWLAEGWEAPAPLLAKAQAVLDQRHEKVLQAAGGHLAELDAQGLHRLRIRLKQLRYAVEFFSDLFPGNAARRYTSALAKLQDCLGTLQDVAMTPPLLGSLTTDDAAEEADLARAAGVVAGWQAVEARRARGRLDRRFERFLKRRRFWTG
jgi:inorganic triphosphatase YgiF